MEHRIKRKHSVFLEQLLLFCFIMMFSGVVFGQKVPAIFDDDADNTQAGTPTEYLQLIKRYNEVELADTAEAKLIRNKLIFTTVTQIDGAFRDYKKGKTKKNKWLQTIFDVLEVGATTAISIMNGERARDVTADALNGFQAGRNRLNKNFNLIEFEAVFNKLEALRADKLALVYERLDEGTLSFPWKDAKSMLRKYIDVDINEAVVAIAETTRRERANAENRAAQLKRLNISTGVTKAQYELAKKNFQSIRRILREFPADAPAGADASATKIVEEGRDKTLTKLRGIFDIIVSTPEYSELLETKLNIPARRQARDRLMANTYVSKSAALNDYDTVLTAFNEAVTAKLPDDPKLAEKVEKIIPTN